MNGLNVTCTVLFVNPYSFKDEAGVEKHGITVQYIMSEDMKPAKNGNERGYRVAKCSLTPDKLGKFVSVPGIYSMTMGFKASAAMKMEIIPTDLDFICEIGLVKK